MGKVKKEYLYQVNAPWLDREKLLNLLIVQLINQKSDSQVWRIINFYIWAKLNKFY